MAAAATCDELIALVRRSALLDEPALDGFLEQLPKEADEQGPSELARRMIRAGLLTHFQAEQLLAGKYHGFNLGKYRILERLGAGGMGTVFLAVHIHLRRRVAVKILPSGRGDGSSVLDRFYREARAAAALDHPNIARAYDVDREGKLHFLVMEYVDGASLQDVVDKHGPLAIERALNYLRQAAVGLQHAHQVGLIHRDIKPGNLMLDRQGTVKILDMGLARFFGDQQDNLTRELDGGNMLGTADYIAPEQAMDSHGADIRADIYSLGFTGFFLLTGTSPFGAASSTQKLLWHQVKQPRSVCELRPEVPEEVAALLLRTMRKDPAERFPTPGVLAEALAAFVTDSLPPPPDEEMPRLCLAAQDNGMISSSLSTVTTPAPTRTQPLTDLRRVQPAPKTTKPRDSGDVPGAGMPEDRPTLAPPHAQFASQRKPVSSAANQRTKLVIGIALTFLALTIYLSVCVLPPMLATDQAELTSKANAAQAAAIIRPEAGGSITLRARAARIHGTAARYERNSDNIGFWTNSSDYLAWQLEVPAERNYEVEMTWSCEGDGVGTRCEFQVGEQRLTITIKGTSAWHLYQTEIVGSLRLPPGQQQAVMRVLFKDKPELAALNLRTIKLVPKYAAPTAP